MKTLTTFDEVRAARSGRTVLVPTMGALHAGHLSLIELAHRQGDRVVVSIFVNPLQFDRRSDLASYPRPVENDLELCEKAGVDLVFLPSVETMYPRDPQTRVDVGEVARFMEGAHRPGHFAGVATVVTKLLAGIQPEVAVFGRKDAQQLAVIRTMVADLSLPVEIVDAPTVRESDGLAVSSRNVNLDETGRAQAVRLSAGLFAAADLIEAGVVDREPLLAAVSRQLGDLRTDYIELADRWRAQPLSGLRPPAFLAVAAWVGETRLIDNVAIDADRVVDRGVRP